MNQKSEVVYIKKQIDAVYDATHAGLYALASGTARHVFLRSRMERIKSYHQELVQLVGEEVADELLCRANDSSCEWSQ